MAVKMRLRREGKRKQPFYRVVVADARFPRDGRFTEDLGYYQPLAEPSDISIDRDRALHWLRNGAQPSDAVRRLLRIEGIWEEFKPGDPGKDRSAKNAEKAKAKKAAAPEKPAAQPAASGQEPAAEEATASADEQSAEEPTASDAEAEAPEEAAAQPVDEDATSDAEPAEEPGAAAGDEEKS